MQCASLAKSVLCGLTLSHTRQHMYRSAIEGAGFSINQNQRGFEEHENHKKYKPYQVLFEELYFSTKDLIHKLGDLD